MARKTTKHSLEQGLDFIKNPARSHEISQLFIPLAEAARTQRITEIDLRLRQISERKAELLSRVQELSGTGLTGSEGVYN